MIFQIPSGKLLEFSSGFSFPFDVSAGGGGCCCGCEGRGVLWIRGGGRNSRVLSLMMN